MNKKLIFQLSLFGLAMAIATVFLIPPNIEPICWLLIFILCAYLIAKTCSSKFFLHGFLVSLVNCFWVTLAHIIFFDTYLGYHPQEAEMLKQMPVSVPPKLMMLITGSVIGIISGFVLGLFAFVASIVLKKK